MKQQVFSLHDAKVGAFLSPFMQTQEGAAVRSCVDLLSNKEHAVSRHANDYALYKLADFDDETGVYTPCNPPALVIGLGTLVVK